MIAHDAFAVRLERIGADRGVGDHHQVVLVLDRFSFLVVEVTRAGELEGDKDMIVDFALVAIKEFSTESRNGQWMDFTQEDTAGIELMAAQLGHESAAGAVEEPPAHQLFHALVTELTNPTFQGLAVVVWNCGVPTI